jgi:hypothetical protein
MNNRLKGKLLDFLIILLCIIPLGCSSTFKGWGNSLENGVAEGARTDSLTYKLVVGAREGLTNTESRLALDSLIRNLGDSTSAQLAQLRDSLIGFETQNRIEALRESLLGQKTKEDLLAIKNSLLDQELQIYLANLLHELNDSTKVAAAGLRDSLLGGRTNNFIKAIIDTAMNDLQSRLKNEVYPEMRGNLGFVTANATLLLVVIGFIALVICWYIWRQKEKYVKISKLLTVEISRLPDATNRQALKKNISENAKTIGIEDDLRELLQKQGI